MIKKLLVACAFTCAGLAAAEEMDFAGHTVDLMGPKDITIPNGWSSWSENLPVPVVANCFQPTFWTTGSCQVIPLTNVSVKFAGLPYWVSTTYRDGSYQVDGAEQVTAIKLDFYQTQVSNEMCVIKVTGCIP